VDYTEINSVIKSDVSGSRRLSNVFWSVTVSLGGFGFFLTGLSSFFGTNLLIFSDSSEISFIPQGIVLLFYGTVGSILGIFLILTIYWNVGSGYNEFNRDLQKSSSTVKVFLEKIENLLSLFHLKKLNQ